MYLEGETSNTNSSRCFNETTAACEYDVWIYNLSSERFLVHLEGETSNALFEVLEDWDHHLRHVDFSCLDEKIEGPQP